MTAALSTEGLARLHDVMAGHVDAGRVPAIFRIASMTKPITAAATMALVEEGVLSLDQSIDDLLPELADRRVLRAIDAELVDTVPARRSITVEDLLSFRMGFGTVMAMPGTYPIQRAEADLGLQSIGGPPWPPGALDVDGWMAALGSLPLMYQPGEQWMYNTSAQVLGVLLARATGRDVATDRLDRLTTFYVADPGTDDLVVLDDPAHSWWAAPAPFPDACGWLVSTIDDYWAFVSMLLAGGTGTGTGTGGRPADPVPGVGGPDDHRSPHPGSAVTGILLTQRQATSPAPPPWMDDFWAGVNAATVG